MAEDLEASIIALKVAVKAQQRVVGLCARVSRARVSGIVLFALLLGLAVSDSRRFYTLVHCVQALALLI
jgi:hypothetical protein